MNTLEEIRDGDLYALLSVCTDADLAPLVECITDRWTNSLSTHPDFKQHSPNHSRYHKIIGDEIRLFGGNTLKNIFRRKEGPSYAEIVIDVCKKLDIQHELGSTVKNERNILDHYFELKWKSLNQDEREALILETRDTASKQFTSINSIAKESGKFLLYGAALGPLYSTALSITDPAYRVTIPCILHISYLRRKFLEDQQKATASLTEQRAMAEDLVTTVERSPSLQICNSEDEPIIELTHTTEPDQKNWQSTNQSTHEISRLNPLLQAVPGLATSYIVGTTKFMEVVIHGGGELAAAKGMEGGYRAIIKGANGLIKGQAVLFEPTILTGVVNATALYQIVSVAVAQKHLADISQKLSDIKIAVDRIHQFQNAERRAALTGAIRYFEQISQAVLNGELSDSVRNQIEHHEAELLKFQDFLIADIKRESDGIISVKDNDTFGSKGMQEAITGHQQLLNDLYEQLFLCVRARASGWQLLMVFPGEERLKEARKKNIHETLEALREGSDLLNRTDQRMREKIRTLSSIWNSNLTLNNRKLSLFEWLNELSSRMSQCREKIDEDVQAAETMILARSQPVTMMLKIEDGQITATAPT